MNNTSKRYPAEVRERAVRMVLEHEGGYDSQWAAISSVASKLGMTPETLRKWVRTAEIDGGLRAGVSTEERARIKELERENRELRRANEILKAAAAFFGARSSTAWKTLEEVEFATLEWVDWFNHRRLLGSIGDIPPAEIEETYYREAGPG